MNEANLKPFRVVKVWYVEASGTDEAIDKTKGSDHDEVHVRRLKKEVVYDLRD